MKQQESSLESAPIYARAHWPLSARRKRTLRVILGSKATVCFKKRCTTSQVLEQSLGQKSLPQTPCGLDSVGVLRNEQHSVLVPISSRERAMRRMDHRVETGEELSEQARGAQASPRPRATGADDAFRSYLRDLRNLSRLTPAQELELGHRAARGDARAWQRLVEANLRLVIVIEHIQGRGTGERMPCPPLTVVIWV
jgi:Sigma-70 factor, region 1.2